MSWLADWSWAGAALGLTWATGVLLVWRRLPARRRPTIDDRVAPYLQDVALPPPAVGRELDDRGLLALLQPWLVRRRRADDAPDESGYDEDSFDQE